MAQLAIMVVSNNIHPAFENSKPTFTRSGYRWYREAIADLTKRQVEEVIAQYERDEFDKLFPISGAYVDNAGVEYPGSFIIPHAALAAVRALISK